MRLLCPSSYYCSGFLAHLEHLHHLHAEVHVVDLDLTHHKGLHGIECARHERDEILILGFDDH